MMAETDFLFTVVIHIRRTCKTLFPGHLGTGRKRSPVPQALVVGACSQGARLSLDPDPSSRQVKLHFEGQRCMRTWTVYKETCASCAAIECVLRHPVSTEAQLVNSVKGC